MKHSHRKRQTAFRIPLSIYMKTIHITQWFPAAGSLKYFLQKNNLHKEHTVYTYLDDLSIGPLRNMGTAAGLQYRKEFFDVLFTEAELPDHFIVDVEKELEKSWLQPEAFEDYDKIVVWHGNNARERMLFQLCCKRLSGKKLHAVNASHYKTESGYEMRTLSEYPINMIQQPFEEIAPVDADTAARYAKEWSLLVETDYILRIFEDNEVKNVEADHYDRMILSHCTNEMMQAARIAGTVMSTCGQLVSDTYIFFRIRQLINNQILECEGDMKGIRFFKIRLAQ